MKKIFSKLLTLILIIILLPTSVLATDTISSSNTPSKLAIYQDYDYVIDAYDINIIVNADNTYDITETIKAYFNVPKHGLYRTIPLKNEIIRLDGTTSTNKAKISNLSVNNKYTTSREGDNYKIKIGSSNYTVTGEQTYIIKYTYNIGNDKMKNYDEFYFNLIGTEWDTVIGNVTFSITMPASFDSSKLGFARGTKDSIISTNIKYTVNNNTISGSYDGILNANEGLTIRLELEEGYFTPQSFTLPFSELLMFIIPLISLFMLVLLWLKFGHDDKPVETVEFYPPEGFNSLEVGFLYKGKIENKDVVSLLIYLANKGYIKISETNEKNLFTTKKSFKITKLKDYDGDNYNEKLFLKSMFKRQNKIDFSKANEIMQSAKKNGEKLKYTDAIAIATDNISIMEVTESDLYNSFYKTINDIITNTNTKDNQKIIFEEHHLGLSIISILLIVITIISTIAIPTLEYAGITELLPTIFLCIFYAPFYAIGLFRKMPKIARILWLGFTIFHSYVIFSFQPIAEAIKDNTIYLYGLIIGLTSTIVMLYLYKLMPKRNAYGNEMLGKIRGFKNFLITAEKDKLEALVTENPTYFYDILPYTYVLGISDKWIKKFETITLQAPTWYDSPNTFTMSTFSSFINTTMTSAQKSMTSSPSTSGGSSGGGSSGGGSSGGGSGGGGGGSW